MSFQGAAPSGLFSRKTTAVSMKTTFKGQAQQDYGSDVYNSSLRQRFHIVTCASRLNITLTVHIFARHSIDYISLASSARCVISISSCMSSSSSQFLQVDSSATTLPRRARCLTCSASVNPNKTTRNLVVCIDGTANKFGRNNTNVVKLFEAVDTDTEDPLPQQHRYYSSGIGTRPRILHIFKRVQRAISDKFDMAIAWNMEEIVKEAYAWLAGKYQEGDRIYLFGFSRGAYQVRILAGMIYEAGLIKNPTEKEIGTAYDHFDSILCHQPNANDMAREFRRAFSWKDARVHFIGVWDTVSSVGFERGDIHSSAAAHACHIRHALALDECRVKFIPEYFLEMNSPDFHNAANGSQLQSGGIEANNEKKIGAEATVNNPTGIPTSGESRSTFHNDIVVEDRNSTTVEKVQPTVVHTISRTQPSTDECTDRKTANIKEVWFAGSHSDVGGKHRPEKSFHAGNVSLMWMRREAYTSGLCLKARDVLWTDEDLDFGTTNSMSFFWKLVEILPVRHQVSFSGSGENARRLHLFEPRRIIPGQKIHASVQFASTYVPKATFGNGFGNPLETAGPILSREDDVWEKDAIDHTTYAALLDNLTGRQGTTPFYLHRLLFMLRFAEGQWSIEDVSDQRKILTDIMSKQSGLVRLVAIAAYFEAMDSSELEKTMLEEVLVEARQSLVGLIKPNQPDWPRAVALLRPLAKHKVLRDSILTAEVIGGFVQLLDHVISGPGEHFVHVMDALSSLVELYPGSISSKLFQGSRLSLMLTMNDPHHLTAVLRVIVLLTEKEPDHCHEVKPMLYELAKRRNGPVSLLALQALVEVSRAEPESLVEASRPRPNSQSRVHESEMSGTVRYLRARVANVTPARIWESRGDALLLQLFTSGTPGKNRRRFIQKLLNAAEGRHTRARTAATFTLLKLCGVSDLVRHYLLNQGILGILVKQLRFKDSALLAAYALTKCLTYQIFSWPINKDMFLAGYIVNMIRLDYFDEAIGVTEGFTIFEDLLGCGELRRKILEYDIAGLLEHKLGAGKPAEMRMSLIYLNHFRIHDEHSLTRNLVERGLFHLETNQWKTQKAGVAILCSLAQTWFGVEALKQVVPNVVNMLLPNYGTDSQQAANLPSSSNQSKLPSSLLGPAFVLRIMAENETLREEIRQIPEYGRLKHLYLFGDLLGVKETPIWQVNTSTRDDVLDVISQMVKSVDSVEGSTNAGFILPHIQHLDRVANVVRDSVVGAIVVPSVVAGVAALTVIGAIILAPVVASRKIAEWIGRPWRLRQQDAIIRSLRHPSSASRNAPSST